MPIAERRAWAERVIGQMPSLLPAHVPKIVVLAGERYRRCLMDELRKYANEVCVPLKGKPIGKQLQALKYG